MENLVTEERRGTLAAIAGEVLVAQPDATVKLTCAREKPTEPIEPPAHIECDSTLEVFNAQGHRIAALDTGIEGLDWEPAGGNAASLELDLLPLGDTSLIVVRSHLGEGDERYQEKTDEQLFALDGELLREVFRYRVLARTEPGPDDSEAKSEQRTTLVAGKLRTRGVLNLIGTEERIAPGRGRKITTYIWNGSGYIAKQKP